MSELQLPEVTEIQRVRLEPGDRLMVSVEGKHDPGTLTLVKEKVACLLGVDERFVVVTDDTVEMKVLHIT